MREKLRRKKKEGKQATAAEPIKTRGWIQELATAENNIVLIIHTPTCGPKLKWDISSFKL